jgi:putative ABC transport system permease protein
VKQAAAWRRKLARSLQLSLQLLAAHRLRTALSVSGLLAGVAAVIVMVAVGKGAERRVLERVRAMGTDLLVINAAPAARLAGRQRQSATMTTLRVQDATAIAEESYLALRAAPAVNANLVARREDRNANTTVMGTTPDGLRIRNMRAHTGRLFDELEDREQRRVALLGPTLARNLFGTEDPVGREIRVGRVPFDVISVLQPRGVDVGGADLDNVLVIPLATAMRRVLNIPYVHMLFVQARSSGQLEALEQEVREILLRRHGARTGAAEPFTVRNQAVLLRTERAAALAINRLIIGVAALALTIGGIGIIAVMLMSVRERVREIGLRRALGARRKDIQLQFVLESAMLATAGGAAGIILGLVIAAAASLLGAWDLIVPWSAAAFAFACSALLGLAIGVIPAARAARLDPVDALRAS